MTQMAAATRVRRPSIWLLLALGALLAAPASASATPAPVEVLTGLGSGATVAVGDTSLINDTTPHVIDVSFSGATYLATDSAGVVAGTGCAQVTSTVASCTDPVGKTVNSVSVYASGGPDTITALSLGPRVTETGIDGNGGDDTITTGPTRDELRADDGDDLLDGGLGPDQLLGMEGVDTATYTSRTEAVTVSVDAENTPDGAGGGSEGDHTDTENVIGGAGDDKIGGSKKPIRGDDKFSNKSLPSNVFTGGPGNDKLSGGYDKDELDGGAGNDRLSGEKGSDQLDGAAGKDRLSGGPQKDKLKGGPGKDRCSGGKGNDRGRQCENESSIP
jgi:Ca2+-binding RTX toxin-like protein